MSPILVLGVGNTLMTDDGVGIRLMEQLRSLQPALAGVEYLDAGTLSFVLLPRIQDCRGLLVLDAAHLDEVLSISVRLVQAGRASLLLAQQALRDGELLAEGDIRIACVQHAANEPFKPCRIPANILQKIS